MTSLAFHELEVCLSYLGEKKSVSEISSQFEISPQRVVEILKSRNVKMEREEDSKVFKDTYLPQTFQNAIDAGYVPPLKRMDLRENIEQIAKEYKNGESSVALGKKYNCSFECILRILREHGVEIRTRGPRKGSEINKSAEAWWYVDEIISDYQSGYSLSEVAKNHDATHGTIRNILLKHNVKLRAAKRYKSETWEYADIIVDAYSFGYSATQLAAIFECSRWTICSILKKHNIYIRKNGER